MILIDIIKHSSCNELNIRAWVIQTLSNSMLTQGTTCCGHACHNTVPARHQPYNSNQSHSASVSHHKGSFVQRLRCDRPSPPVSGGGVEEEASHHGLKSALYPAADQEHTKAGKAGLRVVWIVSKGWERGPYRVTKMVLN